MADKKEKFDLHDEYRSSFEISPTSGSFGKDTPSDPGSPTFKSTEGRVNVKQAETEFEELNREFKETLTLHRSRTKEHVPADLEKGAYGGSEDGSSTPFDLETTLRGDRAAAEGAGIKLKEIGVLWEDLTVRGVGGTKNYVKTFPMAFVSFFNMYETLRSLFGIVSKHREVDILKSFRGLLKPGEMVLVLGRPGSGCTTFLKVISNQRYGYTGITGDVLYGPFIAETFSKKYRGEAVYNAEDESNTMYATLSVGQTLAFALDTKVPGARPVGLSRQHFKERVINTLLKMFNIEHTKDTMVGGPFIRGISGGERKRVSIAEMMVTNASVCAWDNPTRGLDASTAADYVRSIRVLCDIHKTSTFVAGYQVPESIYNLFDKVMVIDQGRQVYFGPPHEARPYFEGLGYKQMPRQTTADYLTACTDPYERECQIGVDSKNVPNTPDELAEAFNRSTYAAKLTADMNNYRRRTLEQGVHEDFLLAIKQSKHQTSSRNVYSIPFYLQVWLLMKRQSALKWQDKFSLAVGWITCMLVAMLLSTLWVDLPTTSAAAFTRGGVIFISFLFNGFQAFGELVGAMLGRPILNKHRSYTFYKPSALWIAQIGVDVMFQTCVILAFSIMVYFSTGLVRTPGAFFSFVLTIITGYVCMTLLFRTVGILSPDFDVAIRAASVIIACLVLTSGYPIQYHNQKVWIRWLFWVNPVGLGFSSLMINEFSRLNFTCEDHSLIPYGPGYNDINHQVCTLLGSIPGNPVIEGRNYLRETFGYEPRDQWFHWGLIAALIAIFLIANLVLGEYLNWGAGGRTVTHYVKEDNERRGLNEKLQERKELYRGNRHDRTDLVGISRTAKSALTWEAIDYDVKVSTGNKRILNNVYGYVKPGELTALMGASGAGKTTLLDVLAARKNVGVVYGEILVDGSKPGVAFQRGTSYAEQQDVHEPAQTVREAFRFSADLRQPYETPLEEKYAYVEEVISLLELEDVADAIIGSPESGLPPNQRKLITIGVELAARPELLFFLDEPTSGLDSQSAWNIARLLRKLTAAGQAILCTIHQPNSALFQQFDRLLLLQRGGECVYFGDIGEDASTIRDYFRWNGAVCPPRANVAEWMLDAIGAGLTRQLGTRDWGEIWAESPEFVQVKNTIIRLKSEATSSKSQEKQTEYATPTWHQIKHVVKRQSVSFWRTPNYGFTRLFNHVVHALIVGLVFINLDDSRASLQNRVFLIFQVTVLPALILAQVQPKYAIARAISYREEAAKAYQRIPFALSMALAEVPYSLICAVAFFLLIHYLPGLQNAPSRAGYQFLVVLVVEFFAVLLGQMIAALTPSPKISSLLNPPIIITMALFSGVTVPAPQMPLFWRSWLFEIDPFARLVGGFMVSELEGRTIRCRISELQRFVSPLNQTCGEYMNAFFESGGPGYLVDSSTSNCEYCAYKSGRQFYEPLSYRFDKRWEDLGRLAVYVGSSLIILLVAARYINYNKR
ncbi:ATP-binding cassette transporter ABC2 [Tothia fuscella]|uniref:ATP-binding cassette transporter ABC2 n=1 Tax=Tothia fuscella TaxID=1048955 RepID=A0A9P4TS62_9PEZI|nr:ATP-binding cassette transporter ABC2 [Tothia fuscella]